MLALTKYYISCFNGNCMYDTSDTIYDTSDINYVLILLSVLVTIETTQFYKALSQVGTNFTMMTLIIPKRTHKELKLSCLVYIFIIDKI